MVITFQIESYYEGATLYRPMISVNATTYLLYFQFVFQLTVYFVIAVNGLVHTAALWCTQFSIHYQ